jgi:succinate dehydrogenase / fumarate reductase iron-sulfur subunit
VNITLRIQRFNPETDSGPYFKEYRVAVEPIDRILDALMSVKSFQDGSLAFRKSCGHGVCGSDAMLIDGKERLACKTLVREVAAEGQVVTIQPLKHLSLQRDLMVDQGEFFARWRAVNPYLISELPVPEAGERLQSPQQRLAFDDMTKCILCGSCYSACPILDGKNPRYLGPAAIVNAARFLFDSRDTGLGARRPALDRPDGVWACENLFECTRACPRGIKVTKSINLTKRRLKE